MPQNGGQDVRHDFRPWLCALRAFAVEADAHGAGLQVAPADDEHGVDARLLGVGDFGFDGFVAEVGDYADHVGAEFGHDGLGVVQERFFLAQADYAHLLGREPEGEIAGVMLNEEADEALVRAERCPVDAERGLVGVVLVAIDEAELGGHGEVHLVGGDGEFATDGAPHLHVNLRPVERRLVWHFHVVDLRVNQHLPDHVLGLLPQLGFVDVFSPMPLLQVR